MTHVFAQLLVAIVMLAAVPLSGCKEKKIYRIGVSQCSDDDWRYKMNDEINREMIFHDNAVVEIRSADDSNEKQIADIRYFADNGFDIIIAAPNEADALTPVIKEVYESGIPVIVFDRNINGDSFTAFRGADNAAIGRSAAALANRFPAVSAGCLRYADSSAPRRRSTVTRGLPRLLRPTPA